MHLTFPFKFLVLNSKIKVLGEVKGIKKKKMLYLFVKIHEQDNLVLDGGEQVVFVNELVNIFVSQPQVDFQSSIITLIICVSTQNKHIHINKTHFQDFIFIEDHTFSRSEKQTFNKTKDNRPRKYRTLYIK